MMCALRQRMRQRGVAAVEMALLLPLLCVLLAAPLYIARVQWHYTTVQKAAHDAARYLSTVSESEMRSTAMAPAAAALARQIIDAELADLNSGGDRAVVDVQCGTGACGGLVVPTTVRALITIRAKDPFFILPYAGDDGILLTADVQMPYTGSK